MAADKIALCVTIAALATAIGYMSRKTKVKKKRKAPRYWVKPWLKINDDGGPMYRLYQEIIEVGWKVHEVVI